MEESSFFHFIQCSGGRLLVEQELENLLSPSTSLVSRLGGIWGSECDIV